MYIITSAIQKAPPPPGGLVESHDWIYLCLLLSSKEGHAASAASSLSP